MYLIPECMRARAVQHSTQTKNGGDPVDLFLCVQRFPGRTLGERIRRCRLEHWLYQTQLAKRIGVDEMTIVGWEKGRTVPREERLRRLLAIN